MKKYPLTKTKRENVLEELESQDLKCGDVFTFRDRIYVALANQTDLRHTVTNITAIAREDAVSYPLENVTFIVFFRTFKVPVIGRLGLKLNVLRLEGSEIPKDALIRFEQTRE